MKKEKTKVKKANPLAWFIYMVGSKIMMSKHHIKYDRKEFKKRDKKRGCLVFYNHASNKDHFVSTAFFGKTKVRYVITKHFFFNKTLRKVLTAVNAIPREQFKADLQSIRAIKKAIDAGEIVCLAPAGQITLTGAVPFIDEAIVKLIKLCKADVYTLQLHGLYLSYPKWHTGKRKAKVSTNWTSVLKKEELETLSEEEIYQRTIDSINILDMKNQETKPLKIKSKNIIEGLEKVLYYCPKCKKTHTFVSSKNEMVCKNCGNTVIMDEFGFLLPGKNSVIFKNEILWYDFEKELIKEKIKNGTLHLEKEFALFRNIEKEYELKEVGIGKVVLTPNEFYYEGTILGEIVKKEFALDKIFQIPFTVGVRFDVPDSEGTFEFRPLDFPNEIIEYVQAIDAMRELRQKALKDA